MVVPMILFLAALLATNSSLFSVAQTNVAREHYLQHLAYEKREMIQEASQQCLQCITLDPHTVQAHYDLAKIRRQMGNLDAANAEFNRTLAIKPDFAEGCNGRSIAYAQKRQYGLAIREFRRALSIETTLGWAYLNLANAFYEKDVMDSALVEYRKAQQLLPKVEYIRQQISDLEGDFKH